MSNSTEELDIQKRLAAVEEAVKELQQEDVLIAKEIAELLCLMEFHMFALTAGGEKLAKYFKLWSEKLDAAHEQIKKVHTTEKVLDTLRNFHSELIEYVGAAKVDTADKAMDIAHSFIKKYSPVALPLKAESKDDVWLVDIDVGALATKIAKVKVDARTGDVLSYDIPTKESNKAK